MVFKNGVKNIQTAGYNGVRMVHVVNILIKVLKIWELEHHHIVTYVIFHTIGCQKACANLAY